MTGLKKTRLVRRGVQIFFFLFVFVIVLLKTLQERGADIPAALSNFHSICPFGAVESIGRLITAGRFIPKTHPSNFWVLSGVLVMTFLFGKVFCGYICPLGSIQDFFYSLGAKIRGFGKKCIRYDSWKSPGTEAFFQKADKALSFLKYGLLALILVQTTRFVTLTFAKVDPYYALFNFWNGNALPSAVLVLTAVLLISLFVYRPWCRWLCPFGAFLGLVAKISPWKIRRNSEICTGCTLCSRRCPMGIDVASAGCVNDADCIRCGECVGSCSKEGALEHSNGRRFAVLGKPWAPVLFALIFLIPVAAGNILGGFDTDGNRRRRSAVSVLQEPAAGIEIGSSMTLAELADESGMSTDGLKMFLGINAEIDGDTKLRDIEDYQSELTLKAIKQKILE